MRPTAIFAYPPSPYKNQATDGGDPGVNFDDLWTKTARALSGLPEDSLGDFNGDGAIDAADYVVLRKTDGSQAGYDSVAHQLRPHGRCRERSGTA